MNVARIVRPRNKNEVDQADHIHSQSHIEFITLRSGFVEIKYFTSSRTVFYEIKNSSQAPTRLLIRQLCASTSHKISLNRRIHVEQPKSTAASAKQLRIARRRRIAGVSSQRHHFVVTRSLSSAQSRIAPLLWRKQSHCARAVSAYSAY